MPNFLYFYARISKFFKTVTMKRVITATIIGAGNRANVYTEYALTHPDELKIVGVVDPNEFRRDKIAKRFDIKQEYSFADFNKFISLDNISDIVVICTPDRYHFEAATQAIKKRYDVLIEKPLSHKLSECIELDRLARETDVVVGVCHVLRYHPTFVKIKELLDSNEIGQIVNIHHQESVGMDRMAHAYVRGIWRNKATSNPLILAKSCHDLDLMSWFTGKKCKKLASLGSLKWFKASNAPEGSAKRCTDCPSEVESVCPYSAIELYVRRKEWHRHFDIGENPTSGELLELLKISDYGKCVYHADNDVVDHQATILEMEDDITIDLTINGISLAAHRSTHIYGALGEIISDECKIVCNNYVTKSSTTYDFTEEAQSAGHGGSDLKLISSFIVAVKEHDVNFRCAISRSIESHKMAMCAEESRMTHQMIDMDSFVIDENK